MGRILAFLLITCVLAVPTPAVAQSADSPSSPVLTPGDQLQLTVWRAPELSGEFTVTAAGTLNHPLLRSVEVAGLPLEEVEERIRSFLKNFQADPEFSINFLFPVVVAGEVDTPAVYSFGPEITIARAITLAGGPTRGARLNRVILTRGGEQVTFSLIDDLDWTTSPVQSGDHIRLERQIDLFRDVLGPVTTFVGSTMSIVTFVLFVTGHF